MPKILFQNRPAAFSSPGGDTIQMEMTRRELLRLGYQVDISLDPAPPLTGYDLVHVFNLQTSDHGVAQCRNAKRYGTPLALSTIFWDPAPMFSDVERFRYRENPLMRAGSHYAPRLVNALQPMLLRFWERTKIRAAAEMLRLADILLPNSIAETECLVAYFRAPWLRCKAHVVPNGVDVEAWSIQGTTENPVVPQLPASFVLEVARFEPVKNQLRLIDALDSRPEIPLVLVGQSRKDRFWTACQVAAERRGNTWLLAPLPQAALGAIYRGAKVHALPSFRESPGLATLEAACFGANCVVSHHGPIGEYFDGLAWCCDPTDRESIRNAVVTAWEAPPCPELGERVRALFGWGRAGQATALAYKNIL